MKSLAARLEGTLHTDDLHRILYATDASVYREVPAAVVFPRSEADVVATIEFAAARGLSVVPRAGGTSLAGQAVGKGIVIDVSRYLNRIVKIDTEAGYAIVEPGVIRDQLNEALRPLGYWFGPNTSTANRCTLGGMFGNNSCGSTSITVASTREHALGARLVLADGSRFDTEARADNHTVKRVRRYLDELLSDEMARQKIRAAFPRPEVSRRNNGYALDLLLDRGTDNLMTLLAGSEGTLAFTTRLKVRILPLPPPGAAVVALHFRTIDAALRATQHAMTAEPFMCELMDDTILKLARTNPDQRKNATFVEGTPRGLILVEVRAATDAAAGAKARELAISCSAAGLAEPPYAAPVIVGAAATAKVWALRAAGLGILGNMVGDAKAVACIEDTAVALDDLADYIAEVETLMAQYEQDAVYYAHAGAGELHLRPVLNLKTTAGREDFYRITRDVARLVKKYRGSLSGEHGDGRVRGPFLEEMLGTEVYGMLVGLKRAWDPHNVLNPGRIVEVPAMNEDLRYAADQPPIDYATTLDFADSGGMLAAAERCNGSGDCRKLSGGAMCPSYRATRAEKDSTRGRANALREVLTQDQRQDPFASPVLAEALDLCLSCKACTSECPSTVNMTALKAEYLHQRGKPSFRTRLIVANEQLYRFGSRVPGLANLGLRVGGGLAKRLFGFAPGRSLPPFPAESLRRWFRRERPRREPTETRGAVLFFGDEFTNYQDPHVGRAVIELLWKLGYRVDWPDHRPSGRAHLSKGVLKPARAFAEANVRLFHPLASETLPVVGVEPSAILGFRDEYPKLLRSRTQEMARELANHVCTFDEFIARQFELGQLSARDFGTAPATIKLHVHCHEKALGEVANAATSLALPPNFHVELLDSGCCGMAGSFGYEAEHYEVSRKIAEQSLIRHLRDAPESTLIVAAGTSCRHTVKDELARRALHPAEALLRSWGGG